MKVLAFFEFGDPSASRWRWLQASWALFGLLLICSTWRLWIPQNVYPQVPFLYIAGSLPVVFQWTALAVAMFSLAVILFLFLRPNAAGQFWPFLTFLVSMACLIIVDQHRLQPWAYQWLIYAMVLGSACRDVAWRGRAMALLRIVTLSIYLFSALGKFDHQFLHTVGQQFLGVAMGLVGIEIGQWSWPLRLLLAGTFPLAELLIIVALTIPRLRRGGVACAVALHLALLVVLGPWGLQHQPGVLVWNLFFIAQALLLFSGPNEPVVRVEASSQPRAAWPLHRSVPTYVVLMAVCLPLLEPLGWFDHWPAWGLYSPRNSRATVEVHRAGLGRLPRALHAYLAPADPDTAWVRLNIDDWSLAALAVPIYPQDRFQVGVAESIATRYGLDRTVRVRILGNSNRWSGIRRERTLDGRQQIVAGADRFRLNAHPTDDSESK